MKIFESYSERDTYSIGRELGERAKPGDVIALVGDLGAGKTQFTSGFAKGLGINDEITSPTYTIMQEYHDGAISLYHLDVYRIEDVEELEETGFFDYFYEDGVCLIEWANLIEEVLPRDIITVTIEKDNNISFDYRKITVDGDDQI